MTPHPAAQPAACKIACIVLPSLLMLFSREKRVTLGYSEDMHRLIKFMRLRFTRRTCCTRDARGLAVGVRHGTTCTPIASLLLRDSPDAAL